MFFDPQDIKMDDPHAGDKLIWNLRGPTYGATMDLRHISWVFLDATKGMERIQRWWAQRYYMEGRLDGGPISEGDGTIMQKTVLVATYPQDIKGLGIFQIRYNDPTAETPDDTWAYLKSVRRARRLTGSSWMDPIGGTVQLYDDWDIWDAVPTKYQSTKLIGRQWIFAVAHAPLMTVDLTYKNTIKEFPAVGMDIPPHFFPAPQVQWEPREVWVIEGIPPVNIHTVRKQSGWKLITHDLTTVNHLTKTANSGNHLFSKTVVTLVMMDIYLPCQLLVTSSIGRLSSLQPGHLT